MADKRTEIEIERLKNKDLDKEKRLTTLEEAKKSWDTLVKETIISTMKWLVMIATAGIAFGWNMPENVRKAISEWLSK